MEEPNEWGDVGLCERFNLFEAFDGFIESVPAELHKSLIDLQLCELLRSRLIL